jgi:hypothetical protein
VYVQEIFDWTDSYNENLSGTPESQEAKAAAKQLTDLWISYANYETSLKQWKKAVQVFEDALQDPLVSRQADVYVSYAVFCRSRNKQSNALKAYVRGLKAGLDDEHYDRIWIEFSGFMSSTSTEKLSFDDLYKAVSQQVETESPLKTPSQYAIDVIEGRAVEVAAPVAPVEHVAQEEPAAAAAAAASASAPAPAVKPETGAQPPLPPMPPPLPPGLPPTAETAAAQSVVLGALGAGAGAGTGFSPLPDIKVELVDLGDMTGFKYPEDCKLYRHRPPSLFSSPETVSATGTISIYASIIVII